MNINQVVIKKETNKILKKRVYGSLTVINQRPDLFYKGKDRYGNDKYLDGFICQCECGNLTNVTRDDLLRKKKKHCGCLSKSKGERRVFDFLLKNNIPFKCEYTLSDLLSIKGFKLRFDFFLTSLNTAIEFDGIQHFQPVRKSRKAKKYYRTLKANDVIKNNYCKDHNIKLIRIPYWDIDNVEDILIKELSLQITVND